MAEHPTPGHPAPASTAATVAVNTATIISPETREELKKGHWGHFLKLFSFEIGILGVVYGLNYLFNYLRMPKENMDKLDEAHKHAREGRFEEAFKTLRGMPFGIGLSDEHIIDKAIQFAREKNYASADKLREFEAFLAADRNNRTKFRLALSLPDTDDNRAKLVADYANMENNTQRATRLKAVGKLEDPQAVRNVLRTARTVTDPARNGLGYVRDRDNRSVFTKVSKRLVK